MCKGPVGLGANLTLGFMFNMLFGLRLQRYTIFKNLGVCCGVMYFVESVTVWLVVAAAPPPRSVVPRRMVIATALPTSTHSRVVLLGECCLR